MRKDSKQKGVVMIMLVLLFIIISSTLLIGISYPVANQVKGSNEFFKSKEGYSIADSQAENALYRFNKGKTDIPTDISLLGATATASLNESTGQKIISIKGSKSVFDRYIKAIFGLGDGISFNYGLQVGNGGLYMNGSSYITGNVYANGDIIGSNNNRITGSAIAATLSDSIESINISNQNVLSNAFDFGLNNSNQDVAQSFVAASSTFINEIKIYVKKTGMPASLNVKITTDNNGPSSTIITSGTLNSSMVTGSFAYIPVSMNTNVDLIKGNKYWIVLDNSSNDSVNYYSLLSYNNDIYADGYSKKGKYVNSLSDMSPNTNDFDMKIVIGGDKGIISGVDVGSTIEDTAKANIVNNTSVTGSLYCKTGSGNNKTCDTSGVDASSVPYPISQANIDDWKNRAEVGGSTTTVNINNNDVKTLGPIKINGDLNIQAGKLYITGPIYVTGDIEIQGSGKIYVDPSLSDASGLIVADGLIDLGGSAGIYGSGQPGSYVVLSSLRACGNYSDCNNNPSILISGSSGSVVLNAPNGAVKLSGSSGVKSIVSKTIILEGSATVNYETGLININFTSGPSGSWVKKSWKEVLGL